MRNTRTVGKPWYSINNGLSPSKTLGMDGDVRRVAMFYCTERLFFCRLNGQCLHCQNCRLQPFEAVTKEHRKESWVDLLPEVQSELIKDFFSPSFTPPPGYNNFPENPERQAAASIQPIEPPPPENLPAVLEFVESLREMNRRGWRGYHINGNVKRAIPAAMKLLLKESAAFRESDIRLSQSLDEAKAEAARTGKPVTITVEPAESKQTRFDDWANQMDNYHKTGREFPLLQAIRAKLSKYNCLVPLLKTA